MTNLYALLEVAPSADKAQLKSAYRRLAWELHPDRNGGRDERFKEMAAAYEVLSDDTRRAEYERQRAAYLYARSAVPCPGCGRGLRVRPEAMSPLRCPVCRTEFPLPEGFRTQSADSSRDRSSGEPRMPKLAQQLREQGERMGSRLMVEMAEVADQLTDEMVSEVAQMAAHGMRAGFEHLRQRLGLEQETAQKRSRARRSRALPRNKE